MHTTLFLVRSGDTEWAHGGRLLGRRDVALSDAGRAQARTAASLLAAVPVHEVLSSPLLRAVETAETIAAPHKIDVARDPRLTELGVARWEGRSYAELAVDEEYRAFLADPLGCKLRDVEPLGALRDRLLGAATYALADHPLGSNVVLVTHALGARVLLAHFLGMDVNRFARLRVTPGSLSVLRFENDRDPPRVLAINHGATLEQLLA